MRKGREITLKQDGVGTDSNAYAQQGMAAHFGVDVKSGGGKSSAKKRKGKDAEAGSGAIVIDGDSDDDDADDDDEGTGNDDALGQRSHIDQIYQDYIHTSFTLLTHHLSHTLSLHCNTPSDPFCHTLFSLSNTLSNASFDMFSPLFSPPPKVSGPALSSSHESLQCPTHRTTPTQSRWCWQGQRRR